jgi:hypothetical protein
MLQDLFDQHGKESVILLSLAGVLVAASFIVPMILGSRLAWNENKAIRLQQAQANYHDALHRHAHHSADNADDIELKKAQSEYEQLERRLEMAQTGGHGVGSLLRWIGGLLGLIGVGCSWWWRGFRNQPK